MPLLSDRYLDAGRHFRHQFISELNKQKTRGSITTYRLGGKALVIRATTRDTKDNFVNVQK